MIKIAILAAGGFVGRSLVAYFGAKPETYKVLPVTRKDFSLLEEDKVYSFIKENEPDIIFNCANEGGARGKGYAEDTDIVGNNLRMFLNIERAISDRTVLVNFGSGAQYNKKRDLVKINEEKLGEVMPHDAYGFSKLIMGKYIENGRERTLNPTIFGLFGPFEDYTFKFISNTCVKNLIGMPTIINQNVKFDYLYVDDFLKILEKLAVDCLNGKKIPHRNFNITPTKSITLKEIAEIVEKIGTCNGPMTIKNPGLNFEYTGDNSRMLENLGGDFEFEPIEESIRKLYTYYKDNLDKLDLDTVRGDASIKHCVTREDEKDKKK